MANRPLHRLDVAPDPIVHAKRPGPLGLFPEEADRGPWTTAPSKRAAHFAVGLYPRFRGLGEVLENWTPPKTSGQIRI